jgi:hypothetical protein
MLVLLALAILLCAVQGESYGEHEPVSVLVNTVGPFNNPAEAYKFYSLPYCAPTHEKGKNTDEKLGEMLAGDRRRASLYDIRFKVGVQWQSICRVTVNQDAMKQWMDAIDNRYVFEMFVDDLSVKGFVGEKEITSLRYVSSCVCCVVVCVCKGVDHDIIGV